MIRAPEKMSCNSCWLRGYIVSILSAFICTLSSWVLLARRSQRDQTERNSYFVTGTYYRIANNDHNNAPVSHVSPAGGCCLKGRCHWWAEGVSGNRSGLVMIVLKKRFRVLLICLTIRENCFPVWITKWNNKKTKKKRFFIGHFFRA